MSLVILEGPDNAGKTTLATELAEVNGGEYIHFTEKTPYEEFLEVVANPFNLNRKIFLDRCWLSEWVYGPVLRGKNRFTLKQRHNLLMFTYPHRPLMIYCHKPKLEDFNDRLVKLEQMKEICAGYDKLMSSLEGQMPILRYEIGDKTPDLHKIGLKESLGPPEWWVDQFTNGYAGGGNLNADLMLIAEVLGPYNYNKIPFEAGPSGRFLSQVFSKTDTKVGDVYLTNLMKTNEMETNFKKFEQEIISVNPKGIIFFGRVAQQAIPTAKSFGIPYVELPHPSYWCRFHRVEYNTYYSMFKEAKRRILNGSK